MLRPPLASCRTGVDRALSAVPRAPLRVPWASGPRTLASSSASASSATPPPRSAAAAAAGALPAYPLRTRRPQLSGFLPQLRRSGSTSTPPPERAPSPPPLSPPASKPGPASDIKTAFQENPYTLPNALTLSRILSCPLLAYCIIHDQSLVAGGLLVYAGVTDYVDGWMARHWNMGSILGSMLDPLADKTLMATLVAALAYKSLLPVPLAVVIVGRDVALALGAFYLRFRTLPPPRTFSRYWDISRPSISIHPTTFSKVNTFLQIALMGALTVSPLLPDWCAPWLEGGMWLVGATTAGSGVSYLWVKGAIRRVPMKP